jgi:hypothetical protein
MKNRSLLGEMTNYLRRPVSDISPAEGSIFFKFKQIFKLWSFSIIVAGVVGVLTSLFLSFLDIKDINNYVVDLFTEQPLHIFLLLSLLWAPITEELTFRLGLKYSPLRLGISLALISVLLGSFLLQLSASFLPLWLLSFIEGKGVFIYLLLAVVLSFVFTRILGKPDIKEKAQKIYENNYGSIFYTFVILFAIVHILNFYNIAGIWYILPLLVFPQLIFGIFLSYIRVKFGITWSIAGHFLHNGIASLPLIFITLMPQGYIQMVESGNVDENILTPQASMLSMLFSLAFIAIITLVIVSFVSLVIEYFKKRRANGHQGT